MRDHCTPIRIAKSRTLTTSNAGSDVEQQKPSFFASGNAKWYSTLGDITAVSYKIKHSYIKSSSYSLWYFTQMS